MIKKIIIIVSSLLMSACSLSPVKTPDVATYTLNPIAATFSHWHKTQKTILVSKPEANPGYDSDSMRYMVTALKLQSYAINRWVAPPAQMFAPILTTALANQHYFKAVVEPPFSGITDYNVQTQIVRFEQNFLQPVSRFMFTLQVNLVNNSSNRIVASQRFNVVVPAPDNNPYAGVVAANKAADLMSQKVAQFVVRSLR